LPAIIAAVKVTLISSSSSWRSRASGNPSNRLGQPNVGPALNNLANIHSEQLLQLDKAYQLAERARQVLPDDPHVADTLGWVRFKRGLYHTAVSFLEESAAKLPAEPELQFHLGMALEKVGRKGEAVLAFQRAARTTTDFPDQEEARWRLDQLVDEPTHAE
jgi:predicted Zn-dependent protease